MVRLNKEIKEAAIIAGMVYLFFAVVWLWVL
jgi:hypothetical protein